MVVAKPEMRDHQNATQASRRVIYFQFLFNTTHEFEEEILEALN